MLSQTQKPLFLLVLAFLLVFAPLRAGFAMNDTPDNMDLQHCTQAKSTATQALNDIDVAAFETGSGKQCDHCIAGSCTFMSCASAVLGLVSTQQLTPPEVSQTARGFVSLVFVGTSPIPLFKPPRV